MAKSELYGWLRLEQPLDGEETPPGWCHFPQREAEYFKQLTAEHLVSHRSQKGFPRWSGSRTTSTTSPAAWSWYRTTGCSSIA
jgi:phage terminase large subunit GpA-like protein